RAPPCAWLRDFAAFSRGTLRAFSSAARTRHLQRRRVRAAVRRGPREWTLVGVRRPPRGHSAATHAARRLASSPWRPLHSSGTNASSDPAPTPKFGEFPDLGRGTPRALKNSDGHRPSRR